MHDVLFRNQLRLEPADLRRFEESTETPSLFIHGRRDEGPRDAESLSEALGLT